MKPYLPLLFAASAVIVSGCASCPCKCPLGFCKSPEPKVEYSTRSPAPKSAKLASTTPKKTTKSAPTATSVASTAPASAQPLVTAATATAPSDAPKNIVQAASYVAPTPVQAPAQVDFNSLAQAAPEIAPQGDSPISEQVVPTAATDKPLVAGDVLGSEGYGRAEDYSWIQGSLTKVHARGGFWQLRYAPFDQIDNYGGNFIITTELEGDFSDGDTVRIEGRALDYDRKLNGTCYQVHSVRLIRKGASMLE